MTRFTIRELVRRRLQEVTAENWSDSQLNTLIDIAYAFIAREVRKINREAIIFWHQRAITQNVNWYALPEGYRGLIGVFLHGVKLERKSEEVAAAWTGPDSVYCHRGGWVGIWPTPVATVADDLMFQFAPSPTLGDDNDFPRVDTVLQYGIVLWTVLLAKGESPESDSKEAVQLGQIIAGIPEDYANQNLDQPLQITIDVASLPAGSGPVVPNDVFPSRY